MLTGNSRYTCITLADCQHIVFVQSDNSCTVQSVNKSDKKCKMSVKV